jgi:ATP-binding cassette subfamily B protein
MLLVVPKFRVIQKLLDRINGITREHLTGIRVVRAYNAEGYQEEKFEKTNEALTKTSLFAGRLMGAMNPLIGLVMNGVTLAIYWVGAYLINGGTGINYADVTQYMVLSTQIIMSIMMLLFMFIMIPRAMVSAKRINEVLDTKNPILEPEVEEEVKEENRGSIEFKDVSFKYPGAENNVVSSLSFAAKKGETLAFIGSTASGKSTVINLLARLYDASEGSVLVDGVNVKNLKNATLRKTIGFVPQKGILFSGTVRENIAFSDDSMPEERIRHAAEIACADEFIEQLPEKYDAPISQGGTNVSGGQKQRLCIARAIASKPDILVFDDSFSALDFKTDQKVRANLKKEAKDITKVIVAQRIGTIMDADHIVVLSEGKIVGYGRHKDLLHSCPVYQEIALSQLSKEELGL